MWKPETRVETEVFGLQNTVILTLHTQTHAHSATGGHNSPQTR